MRKLFVYTGILLISVFLLSTSTVTAANDLNKTPGLNNIVHDSTYKMMHGMKIRKVGDDSLIIYLKKKDFHHFTMDGFPYWHKKGRFYGHWAGFEIGLGGYVNSGFNMNFPPSENYLNINTARSIMLNFNLFEFNLNLVQNHFGFTSGLGFQLNNYYFTGNQMLIGDSNQLTAYKIVDNKGNSVTPTVNKLFIGWINIPLLFEYQTKSGIGPESFHIALGVIPGVRIGSYTKQKFNESESTYYLADSRDTIVGNLYPDNKIIRIHGVYHLNAFKLDATVRIGWSFLNLFATYSITPMFVKNQGPVVYPWNVGITLMPW
jgi:hypothetical protein